jgi:hypothetical protein
MINQAKAIQIQSEIRAALEAIAKKHNLNMGSTKVNYAPDSLKVSCAFTDQAEVGDINPEYLRGLKLKGWEYGLTVDMLGKKVMLNNKDYTFSGMRGKYAILKNDDKFYKFEATAVAHRIAA